MSVVMNLQEAAQATSATLIGAEDGAAVAFRGVSTDSRKIEAGQLFIALRGENFDDENHPALLDRLHGPRQRSPDARRLEGEVETAVAEGRRRRLLA